MSSAKQRIWSGEMYEYHCQRGDKTVYILDRKTKPRMGQVITAYGYKWQVWYIEEGAGSHRARLEPFVEISE